MHDRQPHIDVSFPLSPSLPLSLKIKKIFKKNVSSYCQLFPGGKIGKAEVFKGIPDLLLDNDCST